MVRDKVRPMLLFWLALAAFVATVGYFTLKQRASRTKRLPPAPDATPRPAVTSSTVELGSGVQITQITVDRFAIPPNELPPAPRVRGRDAERLALRHTLDDLYFEDELTAKLTDEEVERLAEDWLDGQVRAALVVGPPGIGKTTLALDRGEDSVPADGSMYVDLGGSGDRPMSAIDAQRRVIHAFDVMEELSWEPAAVSTRYRELLAAKRVFLLLDDAADDAQLAPLLVPGRAEIVVTSQRPLIVETRRRIELGPLDAAAAAELLGEDLPVELRDAIVASCEGVPRALALGAAALEHGTPPADYARKLADARREHRDPIAAAVSVQLAIAGADHARRWRELSVIAGDFTLSATAAIWEIEEDEAFSELEELSALQLLDGACRDKFNRERACVHPMLRALGRAGLDAELLDGAERRHAQHYFDELQDWMELWDIGETKAAPALYMLDLDRPNLEAALRWASRHADVAARVRLAIQKSGKRLLPKRLPPDVLAAWS